MLDAVCAALRVQKPEKQGPTVPLATKQQGCLEVGEGWEEMKQKPANPSGPKVTSNSDMGNPTMPSPAARF